MKARSFNMLVSAMLVTTLTACSAFDTPKKRTAARKAPAVTQVTPDPAPQTACKSCGAAGSLAKIDTAAGDSTVTTDNK